MTCKGRPKRLSGPRCPECGQDQTAKDGLRKAKGESNGLQLWRCKRKECRRQFIERGHRNPAHTARAYSLFVDIPDSSKQRASIFREWADKLNISYRTLSRWYTEDWKRLRKSEARDFQQNLLRASKPMQFQIQIQDRALQIACQKTNSTEEYRECWTKTLLLLAIKTNTNIEVNLLNNLATVKLLQIYSKHVLRKKIHSAKSRDQVIEKLVYEADWEETRSVVLQKMPHLKVAYDEALNSLAYKESDPVPYMRLQND